MKLTSLSKLLATFSAVAITELGQSVQAAENIPGVAEQPATYFYTGKPYDVDLESYTFYARNYNPEVNRWTSADPSGFPDGANNTGYRPVPTSQLDPLGLLTISSNVPNPKTASVTYASQNYTVTAYGLNHINPAGFTFAGWNISAGTGISGTLNVNASAALQGGGAYSLGAQLNISASGLPTLAAGHDYGWIQSVTTNDQSNPGTSETFIDNNFGTTNPLYDSVFTAAGGPNPYFYDWSRRDVSDSIIVGGPITWSANLYLVDVIGNNITVYDGISWGWTIE